MAFMLSTITSSTIAPAAASVWKPGSGCFVQLKIWTGRAV